MTQALAPQAPPFCPHPDCRFHRTANALWRYVRIGFFTRQSPPHRIQRYRCDTCRRSFSTQTFSVTYWLRQPRLLLPLFHRLVGCSGYRQIAREFGVSPQTVLGQAARLGRHCLLFHEAHRPRGALAEPVALDSFESFEWSQYYPTRFHVVGGRQSHFFYGFTESECRRSGRMTLAQKERRAELAARPRPAHPPATQ